MGTCGECSRECFCYLLDDLCHVLSALVLQAGELEQLCDPPDADDVVLVKDLSQGPAAQALETRQQVHVCHAQHVVGVFRGQLARGRGELASRPTHSSLANRLLLCFSRDSLRCCSAHTGQVFRALHGDRSSGFQGQVFPSISTEEFKMLQKQLAQHKARRLPFCSSPLWLSTKQR